MFPQILHYQSNLLMLYFILPSKLMSNNFKQCLMYETIYKKTLHGKFIQCSRDGVSSWVTSFVPIESSLHRSEFCRRFSRLRYFYFILYFIFSVKLKNCLQNDAWQAISFEIKCQQRSKFRRPSLFQVQFYFNYINLQIKKNYESQMIVRYARYFAR